MPIKNYRRHERKIIIEINRKNILSKLFWAVSIICVLPFLYNIFGLAGYGYGYTFGGLALWLLSPICAFLLWLFCVRDSLSRTTQEFCTLNNTVLPILLIAWVGTIFYVFFVFLQRLPSNAAMFDVKAAYDAFGPGADETIGLSPLGAIGAITAPISLLLIPNAIFAKGAHRLYLAAPAAIFISTNLLMGKRQILMFSAFLLIFTFISKDHKFTFRNVIFVLITIISTIAVALYFGFARSGFGTLEVQLYHNSKFLNYAPADYLLFAGLIFLYVGGGAEVLSVATSHFQPSYLPFSVTNSFILRRINSFFDYVDYERDVAPYTSGILEYHLGSFGRIWAGGNLQLFAEGGYIWVTIWYTFLIAWFIYIRKLVLRNSLNILDISIFTSVFMHHMFVFPLRDQLIFFVFVYYVVFVVLPRHIRWDRRR